MTDKLDLSKPMQTVGGEKVELITMKGREPFPLVGYRGGARVADVWSANGKYHLNGATHLDLINTPEPKRSGEFWVNVFVYNDGHDVLYELLRTRERADRAAVSTTGKRIACVYVPWTEGEGLE